MKVGIRIKLVILLVLMALLPLLAALATIIVGGRRLRSEIIGQGILSVVSSEARVMQTELQKDIELLRVALQEPVVFTHLEKSKKKLSQAELAKLDRGWASLPLGSGLMRKVLRNGTADILRVIQKENTRIAELMVTDRFGQLIAATQRTSDFYQGDEQWWRECFNEGRGMICIPYVRYDRSAGVWALNICIPIMQAGRAVGVAKAVLDIRKWLPECTRTVGGGTAFLVVIAEDGFILHCPKTLAGETQPKKERFKNYQPVISAGGAGGWRVTPEENIEAFAPVVLPGRIGAVEVRMSRWTLVLYMPLAEARGSLTRLSVLMLLVGLIIICVLFFGGVLVVDRGLINRIRRLSQGARRVAEGELRHRADTAWAGTRLLGTDEIDDLAHDVNNMVRKLQRSYTELTEANQLKEHFIRIAGHELRTPVSYIVGMAKLMEKTRDPERLAKAIDTMGFKAGRLDEIIQAMFKLIPTQRLAEGAEYSPVILSELLEGVYLDCQPWIERRKQRLVIEPGDSETIIQTDGTKLRDIIENLAMNAIKFTPDNGLIKIAVQRQLGGHVAIEITDQGPGIPESDRPHIFEPFYSGSDILKHSTGKSGYGKRGMGLGLAIVKHYVDLLGGNIEFTTSPSGTTFVVQLPIEP